MGGYRPFSASGPDGGDDYASSAGNGFGRTSYDDRGLSPDDADSKALEYLSKAGKGEVTVGVPVYFFFSFASVSLTDRSQLINLDAIVELAKEWHLTVRVTGAADSATGSADGNTSLSEARAEYISRMLQERGVPEEKIQTMAEGGIKKFSPPAVNRQCRVDLYF